MIYVNLSNFVLTVVAIYGIVVFELRLLRFYYFADNEFFSSERYSFRIMEFFE